MRSHGTERINKVCLSGSPQTRRSATLRLRITAQRACKSLRVKQRKGEHQVRKSVSRLCVALSFQAATSSAAVENSISSLCPRGASSKPHCSLATWAGLHGGSQRAVPAIPNTPTFLCRGRHTTYLQRLDPGATNTWHLPVNEILRFHAGQMGLKKVWDPSFPLPDHPHWQSEAPTADIY